MMLRRLFSAATTSTSAKSIGFCGLGNMGASMASNLIKSGHKLTVYDVNQAATQKIVALGAQSAKSPAELAAAGVDVIVTMVPSTPHAREVYAGANGVFSTVKRGTLLIDSSTIDPAASRELSQQASAKGAAFVDAPVSGGVGGAAAGTLTFMVGGDAKAFADAKPVLLLMGKNILHCGAPGSGLVVKLCNNLMLAISMIGVSEAMNLGVQQGMDAKVLAGVLNVSSARCWSSDTYNPVPGVMENVPSSRNYEGGFASALMAKDVALAINAANDVKAPLPLGGMALQIYNLLMSKGHGNRDFSVIYEFLSKK